MICRTGVQDRLEIRLAALVELPFESFRFLLRLARHPLETACESGLRSG
jgi:hypothetical protein